MKTLSIAYNFLLIGLLASMFLVGCGGGGTSSSDATPSTAKVLRWTPPQSYADQTMLDPARDLDHYEIYVNETGNFASTDSADATVSAIDPKSGVVVTSFDLANLSDFLTPKMTYYLSMKSVSLSGVKSDFSPPVSFSL